MNESAIKRRRNLTLTAQCIRITLFVYVYMRACDMETAFLDSFLNPLFFVLDGMAFSLVGEDEKLPHFVYRKFRQFILPYYFLAFLLLVAEVSFAPMEHVTLNGEFFLHRIVFDILPEFRTYSLWYLPSLFWSELFCYFIIRLTKDKIPYSLLLVALMMAWALVYNHFFHRFLFWSMDTAFIGSVYLYLGYLLVHKKSDKVFSFLFQNRGISLLLSFYLLTFSLFASLSIYRNYDGSHFSGTYAIYSPYQYVIPLTFVGVFGILFLAHAVENIVFITIGQMTMIILAIEQEIGIKLFKYIIAYDFYMSIEKTTPFALREMGMAILGTLMVVCISIPVYYFFMKTPLCVIFNRKWPSKKKEKISNAS